jgi:hypothetical protein
MLTWWQVYNKYTNGLFLEYIQSLSQSELHRRDENGESLIHVAALTSSRILKFCLKNNFDPNLKTIEKVTPLTIAILHANSPEMVDILIAAGANIRDNTNKYYASPFCLAVVNSGTPVLKTFIANGARLSTVPCIGYRHVNLGIFERGVLKCRAAVVALLVLKRRGLFPTQDRFVIREIGIAIWATRQEEKIWQ